MMRALCLVWLVVAVSCLVAMPAGAAGRERTGPDSFLPYRSYSVDDLVAQVQNDSVVRQRLAKHFHVSQAELVTYLRDNVKVVTFSDSGWKPVYGVTRTGRIYRVRDYFNEGGKVFGLADGTPVLKYACGNPLITQLPPVKRPVPKPQPRAEIPPVIAAPPQYSEVVEVPAAPVVETPAPEVSAPEENILIAQAPVAPRYEVLPTTPSSSFLPFLFPLFLGHGGDGPPVVPEPSSLVLLAGGLAAVAGVLRRRRRS